MCVGNIKKVRGRKYKYNPVKRQTTERVLRKPLGCIGNLTELKEMQIGMEDGYNFWRDIWPRSNTCRKMELLNTKEQKQGKLKATKQGIYLALTIVRESCRMGNAEPLNFYYAWIFSQRRTCLKVYPSVQKKSNNEVLVWGRSARREQFLLL